MKKENREQEYYRFEFSDRQVDDPSQEFVNVPGDITVKELYESGIVGYHMAKTKLRYENTKEIMQSDKYIKPIYTENKEAFYDSDSTLLSNGDIVTLSRDYFGERNVIIEKSNGKILRNRQRKKKERNPLTDVANSMLDIQSLDKPIGQVVTLNIRLKKDNIFKRIWNKIKW